VEWVEPRAGLGNMTISDDVESNIDIVPQCTECLAVVHSPILSHVISLLSQLSLIPPPYLV
jgi:hypothetical protein